MHHGFQQKLALLLECERFGLKLTFYHKSGFAKEMLESHSFFVIICDLE